MKFTIEIDMADRWVPHFLGMLQYIEHLGKIGSSRRVTFYADGDGDCRPQFKWDNTLSTIADPKTDINGHRLYDAG